MPANASDGLGQIVETLKSSLSAGSGARQQQQIQHRLLASTKRALLNQIEFQASPTPFSSQEDLLKEKYICVTDEGTDKSAGDIQDKAEPLDCSNNALPESEDKHKSKPAAIVVSPSLTVAHPTATITAEELMAVIGATCRAAANPFRSRTKESKEQTPQKSFKKGSAKKKEGIKKKQHASTKLVVTEAKNLNPRVVLERLPGPVCKRGFIYPAEYNLKSIVPQHVDVDGDLNQEEDMESFDGASEDQDMENADNNSDQKAMESSSKQEESMESSGFDEIMGQEEVTENSEKLKLASASVDVRNPGLVQETVKAKPQNAIQQNQKFVKKDPFAHLKQALAGRGFVKPNTGSEPKCNVTVPGFSENDNAQKEKHAARKHMSASTTQVEKPVHRVKKTWHMKSKSKPIVSKSAIQAVVNRGPLSIADREAIFNKVRVNQTIESRDPLFLPGEGLFEMDNKDPAFLYIPSCRSPKPNQSQERPKLEAVRSPKTKLMKKKPHQTEPISVPKVTNKPKTDADTPNIPSAPKKAWKDRSESQSNKTFEETDEFPHNSGKQQEKPLPKRKKGASGIDPSKYDQAGGEPLPLPKFVLYQPNKICMEWKRVQRIGAGLINNSNYCFCNSALQCLTYTAPLANYCLSDEHSRTCKLQGQLCVTCEIQRHIRHSLQASQAFHATNIIAKIRMFAKHMSHGRQEDAHEFLRYLIEYMQKSCLHGYGNLDKFSRETTVINQIFGGFLRSQVCCLRCGHKSNTYDPFMDISLDIKNCASVEKALEKFVIPETLDMDNAYLCTKCKQKVQAQKRFTIHRESNILTIHLKRFDQARGFGKIARHMSFPEKLNIRPYMSVRSGGPLMYKLYAVIQHCGYSTGGGHYKSYVRSPGNVWFCMNDDKVHQVGINSVLAAEAYVLFYQKVTNTNAETLMKQSQIEKKLISPTAPSQTETYSTFHKQKTRLAHVPSDNIGTPVPKKPETVISAALKKKDMPETFSSTKEPLASATVLPENRQKISFGLGKTTKPPSPTPDKNQNGNQKRVILHISKGKATTFEKSPDGKSKIVSEEAEGRAESRRKSLSSKKTAKRVLVPYGDSDTEKEEKEKLVPKKSKHTSGTSHHPKSFDVCNGDEAVLFDKKLNATTSVPGNANLLQTSELKSRLSHLNLMTKDGSSDDRGRSPHRVRSSSSKGSVSLDSSPQPQKIRSTTPWLVQNQDTIHSPSYHSASSNSSVNSTSEWNVTKRKNALELQKKSEIQCPGWTVTPRSKEDGLVHTKVSHVPITAPHSSQNTSAADKDPVTNKTASGDVEKPWAWRKTFMSWKLVPIQLPEKPKGPKPRYHVYPEYPLSHKTHAEPKIEKHTSEKPLTQEKYSAEKRQTQGKHAVEEPRTQELFPAVRHGTETEVEEIDYEALLNNPPYQTILNFCNRAAKKHKGKKRKRKHDKEGSSSETSSSKHKKRKHKHRDRDEYREKDKDRKHRHRTEDESKHKRSRSNSDSSDTSGSKEFEWVEKTKDSSDTSSRYNSAKQDGPVQQWDHHVKDGYKRSCDVQPSVSTTSTVSATSSVSGTSVTGSCSHVTASSSGSTVVGVCSSESCYICAKSSPSDITCPSCQGSRTNLCTTCSSNTNIAAPSSSSSSKASWDGLKSSRVVHELQQMSSSHGYGSSVKSWDGGRNHIDNVEHERREKKRHWSDIDQYEEDLDRGKIKKVKKEQRDSYQTPWNPFQREQERRNQDKYKWDKMTVGDNNPYQSSSYSRRNYEPSSSYSSYNRHDYRPDHYNNVRHDHHYHSKYSRH